MRENIHQEYITLSRAFQQRGKTRQRYRAFVIRDFKFQAYAITSAIKKVSQVIVREFPLSFQRNALSIFAASFQASSTLIFKLPVVPCLEKYKKTDCCSGQKMLASVPVHLYRLLNPRKQSPLKIQPTQQTSPMVKAGRTKLRRAFCPPGKTPIVSF